MRPDIAAVAQDGDAVADLKELRHTMGDIDDAHAIGPQLLDGFEEDLDLLIGDRGRRLIQDQDLGIVGDRLGDLDHLLLGDAQGADQGPGIDLQADDIQIPLRLLNLPFAVKADALGKFLADENIFIDGQVRYHVQLLVHDTDARLDAFGRRIVDQRLAIEDDLTALQAIRAG